MLHIVSVYPNFIYSIKVFERGLGKTFFKKFSPKKDLFKMYVFAGVLGQHIDGEEADPCVVFNVNIAAVGQVEKMFARMPLFGAGAAVDVVVGKA